MALSSTFLLHSDFNVAMVALNEHISSWQTSETYLNNYRITISGLGSIVRHHAEAARLERNCELVAGTEIRPERAKAWGKQFEVRLIYDDYEKQWRYIIKKDPTGARCRLHFHLRVWCYRDYTRHFQPYGCVR